MSEEQKIKKNFLQEAFSSKKYTLALRGIALSIFSFHIHKNLKLLWQWLSPFHIWGNRGPVNVKSFIQSLKRIGSWIQIFLTLNLMLSGSAFWNSGSSCRLLGLLLVGGHLGSPNHISKYLSFSTGTAPRPVSC